MIKQNPLTNGKELFPIFRMFRLLSIIRVLFFSTCIQSLPSTNYLRLWILRIPALCLSPTWHLGVSPLCCQYPGWDQFHYYTITTIQVRASHRWAHCTACTVHCVPVLRHAGLDSDCLLIKTIGIPSHSYSSIYREASTKCYWWNLTNHIGVNVVWSDGAWELKEQSFSVFSFPLSTVWLPIS